MIELFDLGGTIAAHYGCNKEVLMYIYATSSTLLGLNMTSGMGK